MKQNSQFMTYAALLATITFWGLSFVWSKIALSEFGVFPLMFFRHILATILFSTWFVLSGRGLPRLSLSDFRKALPIVLFQPCLYFTFETLSLRYSTASMVSILLTTIPVFVLILSAVFLKEQITRPKIAGVFLSVGGVFLLIIGQKDFSCSLDSSFLGIMLGFAAVLAGSGYTITMHKAGPSLGATHVTFIQMICGTLFFFPLALMQMPEIQWTTISPKGISALVALTVLASLAAFLCFNYALTRIEAAKASIFLNSIPLVTVIGAWAILGESLTQIQVIGALIVVAGVALPNLSTFQKRNGLPTKTTA